MRLVELALAVWRLSSLLVKEDGPGYVFKKLRMASGVIYDDKTDQAVSWNDWTPLTCVLCTSLYVGLLIKLVPAPIRTALTLSAIVVLIEKAPMLLNQDQGPAVTVNLTQSHAAHAADDKEIGMIYGASNN